MACMNAHHISLDGPDAGWTGCGVRLSAAHEAGDTTAHIPYSGDCNQYVSERVTCPDCKREWWLSFEEEQV